MSNVKDGDLVLMKSEDKSKRNDIIFYSVIGLIAIVAMGVTLFDTPTLEKSVQKTIDSVVHIRSNTGGWQGSGVLVAPDLILTARHVAEDTVDFTITFNDGTQVDVTRAITYKNYDVGFIKLDKPVDHVAKLGSIKSCKLGEAVYAIGSPYGDINFNSVTLGVVSSMERKLEDFGCPKDYGWSVLWQTDTNGEPGNSGCPVFSMDGVVRGILVGGFSNGILYCIPCDVFQEDIELVQLMFDLDKLQKEEASVVSYDPYYNYEDDTEYYEVE